MNKEQLIQMIVEQSMRDRDDIDMLIRSKMSEFDNILDEIGAILMVAADFGIKVNLDDLKR